MPSASSFVRSGGQRALLSEARGGAGCGECAKGCAGGWVALAHRRARTALTVGQTSSPPAPDRGSLARVIRCTSGGKAAVGVQRSCWSAARQTDRSTLDRRGESRAPARCRTGFRTWSPVPRECGPATPVPALVAVDCDTGPQSDGRTSSRLTLSRVAGNERADFSSETRARPFTRCMACAPGSRRPQRQAFAGSTRRPCARVNAMTASRARDRRLRTAEPWVLRVLEALNGRGAAQTP